MKQFLLAIGIILVDLAVFFVPLGSFFLAYVVIARPDFFKNFVDWLYEEDEVNVENV